MLGPDGKVVKATASQEVIVDKDGQPVLGADTKAIIVPAGSAIVIPYADGKSSKPVLDADSQLMSLKIC